MLISLLPMSYCLKFFVCHGLYYSIYSECFWKFRNIIWNLNVKLAFYSFNKLSRFIKVHKGVHKGFQIIRRKMWYTKCSNYNAIYMGQIMRKLLWEFQNTSIEILSSNRKSQIIGYIRITNLIGRMWKFLWKIFE